MMGRMWNTIWLIVTTVSLFYGLAVTAIFWNDWHRPYGIVLIVIASVSLGIQLATWRYR